LAARIDEIFDGPRRFRALSLLEFIYPVTDGSYHVGGRLPAILGLAWFSVNTIGAFDDFYFFLRHK